MTLYFQQRQTIEQDIAAETEGNGVMDEWKGRKRQDGGKGKDRASRSLLNMKIRRMNVNKA